jgi:F-type H+-transporting ATPase subunit epsilon
MTIPPLPTSLTLEIVTPERLLVREQVDEVEVPGSQGYFGVLPGHTPMLATLQVGELWYRKGQETTYLVIAFGFAEILPDRVTILAQIAEKADEVDVVRARSAHERAEQRMTRPQTEMDFERARIALLKSMIRLQVSERKRTRV